MHREVIHSLLMSMNGLEVYERVGVVDANGAVVGGGDEVAGEGEGRRSEEGEGGDGGGVVVEGADFGGGGEVVDFDGVVGAAGGRGGAGNGD